jgi:hypothetical protein
MTTALNSDFRDAPTVSASSLTKSAIPALAGRILIAPIFLLSGVSKVTAPAMMGINGRAARRWRGRRASVTPGVLPCRYFAGRLATHAEGGGLRCYELASILGASQRSGEACCRIKPWPAQPVD